MARLDGRKLLLTRGAEDSADWADVLAGEGALPIILPCVETETFDDPQLAAAIAEAIQQAEWIVFTSRRGVDAFAGLFGTELPARLKIATVGKATAASCIERFASVQLIGGGTAEALGEELAADPSIQNGARCLLALAANAGRLLERRLSGAGASVARYHVYRTIPIEPRGPKRALSALGCDAVIFASPSAVTGFDHQVEVDCEVPFVTIGPTTSEAVRALDWPVGAEAREPGLSGIIESLLETAHV
jgi:uroporphyrinogen-III synthase/uroporphyrinogen III methyltransferase/synthase